MRTLSLANEFAKRRRNSTRKSKRRSNRKSNRRFKNRSSKRLKNRSIRRKSMRRKSSRRFKNKSLRRHKRKSMRGGSMEGAAAFSAGGVPPIATVPDDTDEEYDNDADPDSVAGEMLLALARGEDLPSTMRSEGYEPCMQISQTRKGRPVPTAAWYIGILYYIGSNSLMPGIITTGSYPPGQTKDSRQGAFGPIGFRETLIINLHHQDIIVKVLEKVLNIFIQKAVVGGQPVILKWSNLIKAARGEKRSHTKGKIWFDIDKGGAQLGGGSTGAGGAGREFCEFSYEQYLSLASQVVAAFNSKGLDLTTVVKSVLGLVMPTAGGAAAGGLGHGGSLPAPAVSTPPVAGGGAEMA